MVVAIVVNKLPKRHLKISFIKVTEALFVAKARMLLSTQESPFLLQLLKIAGWGGLRCDIIAHAQRVCR